MSQTLSAAAASRIGDDGGGGTTTTTPVVEAAGVLPFQLLGCATRQEHKKLCRVSQGSGGGGVRPVYGPSVTFSPRVTVIENRSQQEAKDLIPVASCSATYQPMPLATRGVGNYLPPEMPARRRLETLDSDPYYSSSGGSDEGYGAEDAFTVACAKEKGCSYGYSPTNQMISCSPNFCNDYNNKLTLQDSGYSTNSLPLHDTDHHHHHQLQTFYDSELYSDLLDFSLKLGYSEVQLKTVLSRLLSSSVNSGCSAELMNHRQLLGQDKILSELIKLGQDNGDVALTCSLPAADRAKYLAADDKICCSNVIMSTVKNFNHHHQQQQQPSSAMFRNNNGDQQETSMKSSPAVSSMENGTAGLRAIVIDGSNVAMTHGHKEVFSCKGIKVCVDWFRHRHHTDIKVFVPQFRKEASRSDSPITDQHILLELEQQGVLIWTPSRRLGCGRRIVCHDDKYIVKTAADKDAVIVSNDEYRDIVKESPEFKKVVEERLLMYSFVDGKFMPPDDPLGRYGPKLDQFLRKGSTNVIATLCPYGRKCTYGNKCKFSHPERPGGLHRSVTDRLKDHADLHRRISPSNSVQAHRSDSPSAAQNNGVNNSGVCPNGHCAALRSQSLKLFRHHHPPAASDRNAPPPNFGPPNNFSHANGGGGAARLPSTTTTTNTVVRPMLCHEFLAKQFSDPSYVTTTPFSGRFLGVAASSSTPPRMTSAAVAVTSTTTTTSSTVAARLGDGGKTASDERFDDPSFFGLVSESQRAWQQHHPPVARNFSAPGLPMQQHFGPSPLTNFNVTGVQFNSPPPSLTPFDFGGCMPPDNSHDSAIHLPSPLLSAKARKNSISDTRLNFVGLQQQPPPATSGHCDWLFLPTSSSVWAPLDFGSSSTNNNNNTNSGSCRRRVAMPTDDGWPNTLNLNNVVMKLDQPHLDDDRVRQQLFYHLSKLFPDNLVSKVMSENPLEKDAQRLCQLILAENSRLNNET